MRAPAQRIHDGLGGECERAGHLLTDADEADGGLLVKERQPQYPRICPPGRISLQRTSRWRIDVPKLLPQQGIQKGFGGEFEQVGHLLADADEADGEVEFAGDGNGDSTLGGAVELGEQDAGDAGGLG